MTPTAALTTAAALAAALLVPGAAGAVIVPQHGMGGVSVGDTPAKVRRVAGPPVRVVNGANEFGPYSEYRYRGFTVTLQGRRRVTSIATRSRLQRTRSGVGVGSTEAQVRAGVRGVRCESIETFRTCGLGVEEPGRIVTRFAIQGGRVVVVAVGRIID